MNFQEQLVVNKRAQNIELEQTCTRMFYGLCLGDSLGFRTEFLDQAQIIKKFGESGIQEPDSPALLTDDSQITIALGNALCLSDLKDHASILNEIAKQFTIWLNDPTMPSRYPGQSCIEACSKLKQGISPTLSGTSDALGSGAAMRASVVGFVFRRDIQNLIEVSKLQARVTHANRESEASAIAAALLIKFSFDGMPPIDMIRETSDIILPFSTLVANNFNKIREVLADDNHLRAMKILGKGFLGREAVPLALYCIIKNQESWLNTVRMAANYGEGDTDTIACIAGGIQAIRSPQNAIPQDWIIRLERRSEVEDLAKKLARI